MPASMISGQASPVAHLDNAVMMMMMRRRRMMMVIAYLKRTKRLWKMCLKLLCLSMAVRGSITYQGNQAGNREEIFVSYINGILLGMMLIIWC